MAWQIRRLSGRWRLKPFVQRFSVMPEVDLGALLGTAAGGAAAWAAIRVEIRFLWRDMRELKKTVKVLQDKLAKLV